MSHSVCFAQKVTKKGGVRLKRYTDQCPDGDIVTVPEGAYILTPHQGKSCNISGSADDWSFISSQMLEKCYRPAGKQMLAEDGLYHRVR